MRELCQIHKLVVAPDGKCVVCRRPPKPLFTLREEHETLISRAFTGVLGVGLLAGIASLIYVARLDDGYTGPVYTQRSTLSGGLANETPAQPDAGAPADGDETPAANANAPQGEPDPARAAGPTDSERPAARERASAAELAQVEVVMYSTAWCEICDRARRMLRARGVVLIEHDIDGDKAAAQKLAELNPALTVPTFAIDGTTYVGFNPWDIEDALHAAAQTSYAARER